MSVFVKDGQIVNTSGDALPSSYGDNWVKAKGPRPSEEYIITADGEWVLPEGVKLQQNIKKEVEDIWLIFNEEASAPATTTEPEGTWKGGEASALAIRGAALLAEDNGLTTAVITDVNREEHELTIEEIKKVSTAILLQWQAAFFKRQAALREIEQ